MPTKRTTKKKTNRKSPRANISPLKKLHDKPKFRVLALSIMIIALGVGGYFVLFSRAARTNNYLYVADWQNDQIKVVNADTQDLVTLIDTSEVAYGHGPVSIVKNPRTTSSYAHKAIILYGTKGLGGCCGVTSGQPQEFGILDVKTNTVTKKIDVNKYTGVTEKTMQILGVAINPVRDEAYISTVYKTATNVTQGRVLIFNLATDTITGKIETTDQSYGGLLAVNSAGKKLYISAPAGVASSSRYIYEYDIASKSLTKKIDLGTFVTYSATAINITRDTTWSPNMNFILLSDAKNTSTNGGKTIKVFDMNSDSFTKTITLPEQLPSISIITNAAGSKVYFKDDSSQKTYAIDGDLLSSKSSITSITGDLVYRMTLPANGVNPSFVALSDDGAKSYLTDISADSKTSYLVSQDSTSYVSLSPMTSVSTRGWSTVSTTTFSEKLTDTYVGYPYSATYFQINDSVVNTTPVIVSPAANSTLTGTSASISFTAGDAFGLDKFEILVDDKLNNSEDRLSFGGVSQYNWLLYLDKNKDGTTISSGKHTVKIRVTDSNGNIATSSGVSYTFNNGTTQTDTTPPAIPTGLKASSVGTSFANLTWTKNTESDLTGYQIHYREASSQAWNANTPSISKEAGGSYQLTGLKSGTSYVVQIRAYDNKGNYSAYSGDTSIKTSSASGTLSAPSGLQTIPSNFAMNAWMYLKWQGVSGAKSYNVYRNGVKVSTGVVSSSTPAGYLQTVDTTLQGFIGYGYNVRAVDASGIESTASNTIYAKCVWFIFWSCK